MNRTNIANIQLNTNEIGEFLQKIQFSIFKDLKNTGIFLRIMIGLFITLGITQRMIVEYWGKDLFNVLRGLIAFVVPMVIEYAVVIMAFSNSISKTFIGSLVWVFWSVICLAFFYNVVFIHFSCQSITDIDVRLHIEGSFQFANLTSFVCIEALGFLYMKVESQKATQILVPSPTSVVEQVKEKTVAEGSVGFGSAISETEVEQFPKIRIDHTNDFRTIEGTEFYKRYANLIPYFMSMKTDAPNITTSELDRLVGKGKWKGKFTKELFSRFLELETKKEEKVVTDALGNIQSIETKIVHNGVKPDLFVTSILLMVGFLSACSVQSSVAEPPKTEKPKYRSFTIGESPAKLIEPVRKEVNPKEL